MKIIKVEASVPEVKKRLRVAAYARVSLDTELLLHSLSAQISHYSELIQKNPEWEYVGVYADEGISGTSIKHRDEFKRLIKDCEEGKIDRVLVKSVSRFARDTVDTLSTTRHLKDLGIDVFFEKENIHSISGEGELMLTLLASFAQEEAESISTNEKWAYRKRYERGIPSANMRAFGYDFDKKTLSFTVNKEEARWITYIFESYLAGKPAARIAKELEKKGVRQKNGAAFSEDSIYTILHSDIYVGDIRLQTYYSPKIGVSIKNRGQVEQFLISDAHEPLVSREDFAKVQEIFKNGGAKRYGHFSLSRPSPEWVICGKCGWPCSCRLLRGKNIKSAEYRCLQMSRSHECDLLPIKEAEFNSIVKEVDGGRDKVEQVRIYDDHIDFAMFDGQVLTHQREFPKHAYNMTPFTRRIRCGNCGANVVTKSRDGRAFSTCNRRLYDKTSCECQRINYSDLKAGAAEVLGTEENLDNLIYTKIKKTLLYKDRIEYHMRDGGVRVWQRP